MASWWEGLDSFERLFWYFALPFSTFFIIQIFLAMLGIGSCDSSDCSDFSGESSENGLNSFYFLTFRNFLIMFSIFGWAGISFYNFGLGKTSTFILALASGLLSVLIMGLIFYLMFKLDESGNRNLDTIVGETGQVYIPIPANKKGTGKIQIVFQGGLKEVEAITYGGNISTGTRVKVVKKLSETTLLVEKE